MRIKIYSTTMQFWRKYIFYISRYWTSDKVTFCFFTSWKVPCFRNVLYRNKKIQADCEKEAYKAAKNSQSTNNEIFSTLLWDKLNFSFLNFLLQTWNFWNFQLRFCWNVRYRVLLNTITTNWCSPEIQLHHHHRILDLLIFITGRE